MKATNFTLYLIRFLIAVALLFISTSAFASRGYDIIDLGTLDGKFVNVGGVSLNEGGEIIGIGSWWDLNGNRNTQAFIWDSINGMQLIPGLSMNKFSPRDFNDSGQIVGSMVHSDGNTHAFYWENGLVYDLGIGWAVGINSLGIVVGGSSAGAFMWDKINGRTNPFGSGDIRPADINDLGRVVGTADNPSGALQAFIWDTDNGFQFTEMPPDLQASVGVDINNFSQIAGHGDSKYEPHYHHSYAWEGTKLNFWLGDLEGNQEWATGVNNKGVIVGHATTPINLKYYVGFVWDNIDGMQNVNDLILNKEGFQFIRDCIDINDAGQILTVGFIDVENTISHAFLLTPFSENYPPTVDAGPNVSISSENQSTTILLGTASDPDGDAISYRWLEGATQLSSWQNVIDNNANLYLAYVPLLTTGQHTLSLEISDGTDTITDEMILTVDNSAPHAAPSGDGVYELNTEVILGGSVSDFDGDTLHFEWMDGQILLSSGNIDCIKEGSPVQLPTYSAWNLSLGTHTITLIVDDGY